MSARRPKGKRASRRRGCIETSAIAIFALLLGVFATSTVLRHSGGTASPEAGEPSSPPGDSSVSRARIRVEVRNGSGVGGAAERMTAHLRRRGFDVVDFGNAESFDHDRTIVIDRSGNPGFAREVATALQGVPIESAPDSTLFLDVTVRIGRDLSRVLKDESEEPPERRRGWRTWLDRIPGL